MTLLFWFETKPFILYSMCLFLEISWVKKCRNLIGRQRLIFPYHSEYFTHAENLELFFFCIFYCICWQNNQRKYNIHCIIHFISLWLIWGKYLPKKGKVREDIECVRYGGNICRKKGKVREDNECLTHSLSSRTFPFLGKYFPHINHKLMK